MALVTRYINTAASPNGNGTTNEISGPNRAYNTAAAWDANEATNLVTDGDTHQVFCTGTSAESAKVTMGTDWVTGASNDITFTGEFEGNKPDTSKYRFDIDDDYSGCIEIACGHVTVEKVQCFNTGGENRNGFALSASVDSDLTIDRCLIKLNGAASAYNKGIVETWGGTPTINLRVRNCVFWDCNNGIVITYPPGTLNFYLYNNTIVDCNYGIWLREFNWTMRNNIITDATVNDYDLGGNGTKVTSNNISSDATSPDGASWQSKTITYTDAANEDYSVGSGETDVVDQGYDITGIFTTSLNGVTRDSTPDCGAHQLAAAVTGLIPTSKTISRAVQRVGHF